MHEQSLARADFYNILFATMADAGKDHHGPISPSGAHAEQGLEHEKASLKTTSTGTTTRSIEYTYWRENSLEIRVVVGR